MTQKYCRNPWMESTEIMEWSNYLVSYLGALGYERYCSSSTPFPAKESAALSGSGGGRSGKFCVSLALAGLRLSG